MFSALKIRDMFFLSSKNIPNSGFEGMMQNIESIESDWKTYFITRRYFEITVIVHLLSRLERWRVCITDSGNLLLYRISCSMTCVCSMREIKRINVSYVNV